MTNDVGIFVASLWCMNWRWLFIKEQEKASALYNHIVVGVIVIPNAGPAPTILEWYGHCMRLSVNELGGSGGMFPQENF